jgi:uncharacterized protein (DUF2252 family)
LRNIGALVPPRTPFRQLGGILPASLRRISRLSGFVSTVATCERADTPATGIRVQACGDCHLCNFGAYATPERRVIFDINDLDETLLAPWEWDVKRLGASFVLACRDNGFSEDDARDAVLSCVRSYREHCRNTAK